MSIRPGNLGYDRAVGCVFGTLAFTGKGTRWMLSTGPVEYPVRLTKRMEEWAMLHQEQLANLHELIVWPRQSLRSASRLDLTVVSALQWPPKESQPRDTYEVIGSVEDVTTDEEMGCRRVHVVIRPNGDDEEAPRSFAFALMLSHKVAPPIRGRRYQFLCGRRRGGLLVRRFRDAGERIQQTQEVIG